jgi:predicted metalloprotease
LTIDPTEPDPTELDPTGPRRTLRRGPVVGAVAVVTAVALVVVLVVMVRSGGGDTAGTPVAAETVLTGYPPAPVRHVGTSTVSIQRDDAAVGAVLADVGAFWTAALPADFNRPFKPLTGAYVSIDGSAGSGSGPCVSSPDQIAGNAYYCPGSDAIVYDSAGLVPVLLGHYGVAGLTASFAHEFGHAIQARIGPTAAERAEHPAQYPNLLIEAQGDCYAGAFLAWAVAGSAPHLRLPQSSMVRAVAPLLDFRDPVTVTAADPVAHGLSLDRLTALLDGYRGGPKACHALAASDLRPTRGRSGVLPGGTAPRFADTDAAVAAGRRSVDVFAAGLPAAAAGALPVQPSSTDLAAAAPYGQFADAAALALALGLSRTGTASGAACFTGAWAASVFGTAARGALGSWAGDADEALDMIRARPAATFAELSGYADGFTRGWPACAG